MFRSISFLDIRFPLAEGVKEIDVLYSQINLASSIYTNTAVRQRTVKFVCGWLDILCTLQVSENQGFNFGTVLEKKCR